MAVDDLVHAAGLPDGQPVMLDDMDDQGVGQQAHDPGGLDPADRLDPLAHGLEVDGGHRLIGRKLHGLLDGAGGLGALAFDEDLLQLQAQAGGHAVHALTDRGTDALGPSPGRQNSGQQKGTGGDRNHDCAGGQVQPAQRRDLPGRGLGVARHATATLGFGSRAAFCRLVRTLSPTAANYRGHEASSTIHRTRAL